MQKSILFLLNILSWILYQLPRRWMRRLGSVLGWIWIDLLRVRRGVIAENLRIAFPDVPEAQRLAWGRHSVHKMGADFLEVLAIPHLTKTWIEKNTKIHQEENLRAALSQGKGAFLLTLHLGNGDLGASVLSQRGYKVFLITKIFKNALFNAIWFYFRAGQGVQFIDAHGSKTAFEILRGLRAGGLVVFVLDQFMGKPFGVETSFFGRPTGTAYGLALLHLKTKAPVVPIYCYEGDDGQLHIVCEPALNLESLGRSDQDKGVQRLTQVFNDVLEAIVKKHPQDWMWVHRRWKEFE